MGLLELQRLGLFDEVSFCVYQVCALCNVFRLNHYRVPVLCASLFDVRIQYFVIKFRHVEKNKLVNYEHENDNNGDDAKMVMVRWRI